MSEVECSCDVCGQRFWMDSAKFALTVEFGHQKVCEECQA